MAGKSKRVKRHRTSLYATTFLLTIVATLNAIGLILAISLLIAPGAIAFVGKKIFQYALGCFIINQPLCWLVFIYFLLIVLSTNDSINPKHTIYYCFDTKVDN